MPCSTSNYLLERQSAVDLSINLPAPCVRKPHDLDFLAEIAREMTFQNIALSIDNLGANWPELMGLDRIRFIKLKADRQFVAG